MFQFSHPSNQPYANALVGQTGVGPEFERILSAKFINTPDYGTVCSTVIKFDRNGTCFFEERTFDKEGLEAGKVGFEMNIG